jgi:hypothetical protein
MRRRKTVETEGPPLEALTRRLAECPPDFLEEPRIGAAGKIHVAAVVSDLLGELGGELLDSQAIQAFQWTDRRRDRNRARMALVGCWLLHDPWFRAQKRLAPQAHQLLAEGLNELAGFVQAPDCVMDADRREELARHCLRAMGIRPAGETIAQAEDRLATLSSVERARVIREAKKAEERARAIREAMARKAAEEAAAKAMRE